MEDDDTVDGEARTDDDEARAADGRRPGRRGLATRQKLLDCTATMLGAGSYRELKVVDIARSAGTSPASSIRRACSRHQGDHASPSVS